MYTKFVKRKELRLIKYAENLCAREARPSSELVIRQRIQSARRNLFLRRDTRDAAFTESPGIVVFAYGCPG